MRPFFLSSTTASPLRPGHPAGAVDAEKTSSGWRPAPGRSFCRGGPKKRQSPNRRSCQWHDTVRSRECWWRHRWDGGMVASKPLRADFGGTGRSRSVAATLVPRTKLIPATQPARRQPRQGLAASPSLRTNWPKSNRTSQESFKNRTSRQEAGPDKVPIQPTAEQAKHRQRPPWPGSGQLRNRSGCRGRHHDDRRQVRDVDWATGAHWTSKAPVSGIITERGARVGAIAVALRRTVYDDKGWPAELRAGHRRVRHAPEAQGPEL